MVRRQDGAVTVQVKHMISFETYKVMVSVLPGIEGVLYMSSLDTFDCSSWEYISLRMTYKTVEGKILHDTMENRHKYKKIGYRTIPPNTMIEQVAKAVCANNEKQSSGYKATDTYKVQNVKTHWLQNISHHISVKK